MKITFKELSELLGNKPTANNLLNSYIGKYVICRTRNEGVNFGKVTGISAEVVELSECRRLWRFKSKVNTDMWYEGVSKHGVSPCSKLSGETSKLIKEDFSLTICTKEAIEVIKNTPNHEG